MSPAEKRETDKISSSLFSYMLQKLACQLIGSTLSDMRSFISLPNTVQSPSSIQYLELINENADSEETMLHVAEELIAIFEKNAHQKWIVLAGDGKSYYHLSNIKRQYGSFL